MQVDKKCPGCGEVKVTSEFYQSFKKTNKTQGYCKECSKKASAVGVAKIRERNHKLVFDYLMVHPCVDCGEANPVVLDFDHITGKKVAGICKLVNSNASAKKIGAEMSKCVIRCANCHRKKTAKDRNSYRYRWYGTS